MMREYEHVDPIVSFNYIEDILNNCVATKCYGYRKAMVDDRIAIINRNAIIAIERRFADETNQTYTDNHCPYQLIYKNRQVMYIRFDDDHAMLGLGIIEEIDP